MQKPVLYANNVRDVIASQLRSGRDQVDVILLDFAKAFDKVLYRRLLYKLDTTESEDIHYSGLSLSLATENSACYWMGADLPKQM